MSLTSGAHWKQGHLLNFFSHVIPKKEKSSCNLKIIIKQSYHKESKEDDSTAPNVCPAPIILFPLKRKVKH